MPLLPAARPDELRGDFLRRRARFGLILGTVMSLAAAGLFGDVPGLWNTIAPLEGMAFLAGATLLGAALAATPVLALLGLILATWNGVESVYQPRHRATPMADKLIVALGLTVWFGPCLALLAASAFALASGRIHFSNPPRDYVLATDPIAFWQGVGFWLIGAAAAGYMAWRYWRPKLGASASAGRHSPSDRSARRS